MKLGVAQIQPFCGDLVKNIKIHEKWIETAADYHTNLLIFPELSLTGYEPQLANNLAIQEDDERLELFQQLSNQYEMTLGIGLPTIGKKGIKISTIFFQAKKPRLRYSKQYLHEDELPFFVEGNSLVNLHLQHQCISPAICYESLLPIHSEKAAEKDADIYAASVAKPKGGVEKAYEHFPKIAKKYAMLVLMSNSVGPSDDFISFGQSAIWNKEGKLVGEMNNQEEGLLIFDTHTNEVIKKGTDA